jgi:methionine-rich copper-binding protein CopC
MSEQIKKAYVVGHDTMRVVNPAGNNVPANFVRGAALYFDAEIKAKRTAEITQDKTDAKAWLLRNR